jgi:hypothetical protein
MPGRPLALWCYTMLLCHAKTETARGPSVLTQRVCGCAVQGYRSFTDAVTDWYNEVNGYSYGGSIGGAGHFTQIVSTN